MGDGKLLMHMSERQQLVEAVHDRGARDSESGSSRGRLLVSISLQVVQTYLLS
jgi:hypothetical protein